MQRYLKFNHGSECPVNIACVYASCTSDIIDHERGIRLDRTSCIAGYSARWEKGQWTREKPLTSQRLEDLWSWVYSLTRQRSTLWVFSHGLSRQAELLGVHKEIEDQRLRWRSDTLDVQGKPDGKKLGCFVPDGHPWLLKGLYRGRSIRIVDICNYVAKTLPEFAEALGYLCVKGEPLPLDKFSLDGIASHSARIVYEWIKRAIDLWRAEDIGTWQPTAAKLAMNAYNHSEGKRDKEWRKHLGKIDAKATPMINRNRICTHNFGDVKRLEREGFHGGQAEAYFLGTYQQSVHYLDVRSMYPYIACTTPLPVRYHRPLGPCKPRFLRTMLEPWIGVARVTIVGPDSCYPCKVVPEKPIRILCRDRNGSVGEYFGGPLTCYPEGRYDTVLCGQELIAALDRGHVEAVHEAHLYQSGNPLCEFMREWWERRVDPANEHDEVMQDLCKLVMNGLIGKLGQRSQTWEDDFTVMPAMPWQQFYAANTGTTEHARFRSIGWYAQRYMGKRELEHSAIAIPACVTAAGREHMRSLRAAIGQNRVLLQDTDGLIVTDAGKLEAMKIPGYGTVALGALRCDDSAPEIEIMGPRHYRWGDRWVLAGLERGWEWSRSGGMQHWLSDWLYSRILGLRHGQFAARLKPWEIGNGYVGRHRLPDGWTTPLLVGI